MLEKLLADFFLQKSQLHTHKSNKVNPQNPEFPFIQEFYLFLEFQILTLWCFQVLICRGSLWLRTRAPWSAHPILDKQLRT